MHLFNISLLCASLFALSSAAPANHLEKRQTYVITCIGGHCEGPTPVPSSTVPKPTSKTTSKPVPPPSTPTTTKTTIKTTKSTIKPTATRSEELGPSSTACPVPRYYQCGGYYDGVPWTGCTKCVAGSKCVVQNEWYDQCVGDDSL
ncbi:carbohydrate-binding module family 1 protein [Plenodomus tracheiphilus IPT5]|uniref:Carbohydrate-binding module family 1 protein n=1 Tax=Plenodomus tracheiphilus IPT5 TaxID=1408161 RepID=A0A6A7B662_9PLEO|nr:carbohydrate-binding module family 1 protein [Plenodomus tracheiphilus IPT5]